MDGVGVRPAMFEIGGRLAEAGALVLLPDLFYRGGPYEAPDPKLLFSDLAFRQAWGAKYALTATMANVARDTGAFLDFLARQPDVVQPRVGTTGYCMGGRFALAAAGAHPDRVVAAATFHGGNLATDAPDSPHLLAPRIRARIYVAGAVEDASFPDDMKARLAAALAAAGVDHRIETYEGLRHGWVPSDMPTHSPAGAERHFQALAALFGATLGTRAR
jgi:carboxymethylenebutenolidase